MSRIIRCNSFKLDPCEAETKDFLCGAHLAKCKSALVIDVTCGDPNEFCEHSEGTLGGDRCTAPDWKANCCTAAIRTVVAAGEKGVPASEKVEYAERVFKGDGGFCAGCTSWRANGYHSKDCETAKQNVGVMATSKNPLCPYCLNPLSAGKHVRGCPGLAKNPCAEVGSDLGKLATIRGPYGQCRQCNNIVRGEGWAIHKNGYCLKLTGVLDTMGIAPSGEARRLAWSAITYSLVLQRQAVNPTYNHSKDLRSVDDRLANAALDFATASGWVSPHQHRLDISKNRNDASEMARKAVMAQWEAACKERDEVKKRLAEVQTSLAEMERMAAISANQAEHAIKQRDETKRQGKVNFDAAIEQRDVATREVERLSKELRNVYKSPEFDLVAINRAVDQGYVSPGVREAAEKKAFERGYEKAKTEVEYMLLEEDLGDEKRLPTVPTPRWSDFYSARIAAPWEDQSPLSPYAMLLGEAWRITKVIKSLLAWSRRNA